MRLLEELLTSAEGIFSIIVLLCIFVMMGYLIRMFILKPFNEKPQSAKSPKTDPAS